MAILFIFMTKALNRVVYVFIGLKKKKRNQCSQASPGREALERQGSIFFSWILSEFSLLLLISTILPTLPLIFFY